MRDCKTHHCEECAELEWRDDVLDVLLALRNGQETTNELLAEIRDLVALPSQHPAQIVFWLVHPDGSKEKLNMAFTLTDIQSVPLAITVTDAKGNPAKVDGAPVWESSDPTILTVTAAADGMSCVAAAVGPLGTAQIKVTADADLGPDVVALLGILDVEVVASAAVNVVIVPGTPA